MHMHIYIYIYMYVHIFVLIVAFSRYIELYNYAASKLILVLTFVNLSGLF